MERFGRRDLVVRGGRLAGAAAALALGFASEARGANALDELDAALRGPLLRPGRPGYGVARRPWNARFDDVLPRAVAQPLDTADVQAIVRWAARHDVRLAVRSGGHSYAGLSSTTGLLVDLSRLSAVTPLPGGRATVGAGATLGAVYARLWAAGQRTIPAGSCPTVGVAGLTLGGGHGFVARAFGLACDSVRAVRIVTADGQAHDVSAASRPSLFWALRGGGTGSFGIVTRLTFATRKVGTVTTFVLRWPWAAAADAIGAWQAFMATAPDELTSSLSLRVPATTGGMPTVVVNGMFLGPKPAAASALAGLTGGDPHPTTASLVQRTYDAATAYFAGGESEPRRIAGSSRVARTPLGPKGRDAVVAVVENRHADPRLRGGGIILFAFGGAVGRVPRKATAYVHRDARFSLELVGLWTDPTPAVETANLAWIRKARLALSPYTSGEALQNYADLGLAGWKRAYYAENLERLVATKHAVDPTNRFRHAQSIPTAL
ncbi:MAG TPA: FAD-binding oxidoreductase [Gaiella sp.]